MKKWLVLLLFGAQFFLLLGLSTRAATAPANLLAKSSILPIGSVRCDSTAEYRLSMQNTGGETCIIEHVATSCGCVAPTLGSGIEVAAGECVEIPLMIAPRHKGTFSASIIVHFRSKSKSMPLSSTEVLLTGLAQCEESSPDESQQIVPTPDPAFK